MGACECCGNDDATYGVCFDCLPPVDCAHGDAPADEDGGAR
jgi:hypothetical protein